MAKSKNHTSHNQVSFSSAKFEVAGSAPHGQPQSSQKRNQEGENLQEDPYLWNECQVSEKPAFLQEGCHERSSSGSSSGQESHL
ncbi:hypothetical protein HWI79_3219 [Cryptosporidium felis]|nr:hypothetical protein HWI79_3219 [Cryptosporidium felis]